MTNDENRMPYALTPETLAKRWGVSAATVRAMVREGQLKGFRVGRQIRIRPEVVEAYEKAPETDPPPPARSPWIPPRIPRVLGKRG